MRIRLLYPSDPLNPKMADALFQEEHDIASAQGLLTSIFSFEDFETGTFRPYPALLDGEVILYRGWMLSLPQYEQITRAIATRGTRLFTSVDAYRRCHHLPEWYPLIKDFTAQTVTLPQEANFAEALSDLHWQGYFVKDYVKSLNTDGGSLVATPEEVGRVVERIEKFRGTIEGGVCVRKQEDFLPGSEQRHFVFKSRPFSMGGMVPSVVSECATRIGSPFFSVDTALRDDGVLRVIEIGDGQVSDRKEWTAEQFVAILTDKG